MQFMPRATLPCLPPASAGKLKHTMFSKTEKGFNYQKPILPSIVGLVRLLREEKQRYLFISPHCAMNTSKQGDAPLLSDFNSRNTLWIINTLNTVLES